MAASTQHKYLKKGIGTVFNLTDEDQDKVLPYFVIDGGKGVVTRKLTSYLKRNDSVIGFRLPRKLKKNLVTLKRKSEGISKLIIHDEVQDMPEFKKMIEHVFRSARKFSPDYQHC